LIYEKNIDFFTKNITLYKLLNLEKKTFDRKINICFSHLE